MFHINTDIVLVTIVIYAILLNPACIQILLLQSIWVFIPTFWNAILFDLLVVFSAIPLPWNWNHGTRDSKPFQANHVFLTSLRTTPEALLQLVRDRWSIEGWHWIRDTQLHEDAHRYRGNAKHLLEL
jgi:predicted transposase YbfD/YdcC